MKKLVILLTFVSGALSLFAQGNLKDEFEQFKKQRAQEYHNYISERNREFADFLKREWQQFESFKGESLPEEPKPKRPPFVPDTNLRPITGPVIDNPLPALPEIKPVVVRPGKPSVLPEKLTFSFYGVTLEIPFSAKMKIGGEGYSEEQIAAYWEKMSATPYEDFLNVLQEQAQAFGLNDWGVYRLVEAVAQKLFENENDRILFCFFLLRQQGLDVKIGRSQDKLCLLMAFSTKIYELSYFTLDGKKYYYIGKDKLDRLYTYGKNATDKGLKEVDLNLSLPLNIGDAWKMRELKLKKFPDMQMALPYNTANIAFYSDMPLTDLPVYFATALPQKTEEYIVKYFGDIRTKCSLPEFVGILLNFVQTSFDYQTDEEQFGREKYFYPEEILAYPFCDCEDRAAFFARLVRNLTGLEVVGLDYPGHIATAVCFGDVAVEGDAFTYKGHRYVVCDPTYINASVGMEMPQYKGTMPGIIEFKDEVR